MTDNQIMKVSAPPGSSKKLISLFLLALVAASCGPSPKQLIEAEAHALMGSTWTIVDVRTAYAGFGAEGEIVTISANGGKVVKSFVATVGHPYRVGLRFTVDRVDDVFLSRNVGEVIVPKFEEASHER